MAQKTSRKQLEQSCNWIRSNWNAHNLDVPDPLLQKWIYNGDDQEETGGFQLAVFSFGYLQHDIVTHNVPAGVQRSVSTSDLLQLFQAWQLKLALAEVHRRTELRVKPLALFSFPPGEQVEAWAEAPSTA